MRMQDRVICVSGGEEFYVVLTPEIAIEMVKCSSVDDMCEMALNECEPFAVTNSNQVNFYLEEDCDDERAAEVRQSIQDVADLYSPPEKVKPVQQADMFNQVVTLDSGRKVEFWVNKKTGEVTVDVLTDVVKPGITAALFNANNIRLNDLV